MIYLALRTYLFGFIVAVAYDDLSYNKVATQSPKYPSPNTLYGARRAIDGNTSTCMKTDAIGINSPYTSMWWKVDLGGVYSIYRIHILFLKYISLENRQRGRFAGFSLYVSNTGDIEGSTRCYKDGQQLPPLNFTTVCTEYGRYVIFYNERLDGETYPDGYELSNVFTELCEVIVQGCTQGFYGSKCGIKCPINCGNGTCHIQNGACLTCKAGWTGGTCSIKCDKMWYGEKCSQQCTGHCRNNVTCNHVTGQCDGGCDAGWTGNMCDMGCDEGTYGYNCNNNCSGHCLNNYLCNKQTGHCDTGCKPGYTSDSCNKVCPLGHYGINCRESCSGHCLNNEPCDHISGTCSNGCYDGFIGTHCNISCTKGYFGTKCSRECSPNCKPDTCRHTDGYCTTCDVGWMGFNCSTACYQSYGENCRNACSPHCYNQTCDRFNGRCLMGCQDGFYGEMCEKGREENKSITQNISNFIFAIGLSISLLINLISIGLLCRRRQSRSLLFCWKKSLYQDTVVKTEDASTYQELDLFGSVYQNTTIR